MGRIRRLPETIANRIAAGEVVERPASVVKELIENSLDAGAKRIDVSIRQGGMKLIVVADDGCGMDSEDALMAIERFATSKISRPEDLSSISTMGFRGEALPSIASVSHFRLVTRPHESPEGTLVEVHGGQVVRTEPIGCPPGTRVEVADLFYNTPARRKFLSSTNTERGHCHDWVMRLAMARPDVAFKFSHDDTVLLATDGRGDLRSVIAACFGSNAARQLIPVDYQDGEIRIWGFISGPRLVRATRQYQFFFVNRRFVRSRLLSYAVTDAYGPLAPTGRHPMVFLHIEIPPELVDPNVHPTKIEVKFAREGAVRRAVEAAIRRALEDAGLRPAPAHAPAAGAQPPPPEQRWVVGSRLRVSPLEDKIDDRDDGLGVHEAPPAAARAAEPPKLVGPERTTPAALGQLGARYIIAQTQDKLVIIDQHRAAERVAFERLSSHARQAAPASQRLAVPVTVELTPQQQAALQEHEAELKRLGFDLEPFGRLSWIIRAVPAGLEFGRAEELLLNVLDELARGGRVKGGREAVLAAVACHGAIKAGQRLSLAQMQRLIDELFQTSSPAVCPHGDPIIFTIELSELDRKFER